MSRFELEHINTLWFMTLGVTAISAGVLVYVLLLESALGAFSIKEFYPAIGFDDDGPQIAMLDSEYTRALKSAIPGTETNEWYDNLLYTWQAYLDSSDYRFSYTRIDDSDLEEDQLHKTYDVLVLPASLVLSDLQVEQLRTFMAAGGSVYASWKTGFYRPDGSEREWDVVQSLFGVSVVKEVDRYQGAYRAYQAVYPGQATPGFYIPVNNVLSGIEETEFPPLSGYRWAAPLTGIPPRADYARADTSTMELRNADGDMERQEAVTVQFFSWQGDDSGRITPYPFSGFGSEQISFLGNTPLTIDMPAGYSISTQVYDPAVLVKVTRPTTKVAAYWTDWVRSFSSDKVQNQSSIVYGTYQSGRFVYAGFRRDAMGVGQPSEEVTANLDHFFSNTLLYLRKEPNVWLREWPAPYEAGALITGVGSASIENLEMVADTLAREDAKGTFFVVPAQADLRRSTVEKLAIQNEVGVLDDNTGRVMFTPSEQVNRFSTMRDVLKGIVNEEITAYRAQKPGRIEDESAQALASAGYLSLFPDSVKGQSFPEVLRTTPRMTEYAVSAWTDAEILNRYRSQQVDMNPVKDDIMRVRDEAGLYQFVYSSDGMGQPRYQHHIGDIVRTLKDEKFWIASASEMTQWWRERHAIKVAMDQSGNSRLVLHLSNQNGEIVQQVGVMIDLGRSVQGVRIRPELIGSAIPRHELQDNNSLLFIKVVSLKPQQTRLFHIDLVHEGSVQIVADRMGVKR